MKNNKNAPSENLAQTFSNLLGQNESLNSDVKNLINSLTPDDISKISSLLKNKDLQKIASSMISASKEKEK